MQSMIRNEVGKWVLISVVQPLHWYAVFLSAELTGSCQRKEGETRLLLLARTSGASLRIRGPHHGCAHTIRMRRDWRTAFHQLQRQQM